MLVVGCEVTHQVKEIDRQCNVTYRFERLGVGEVGWWSYKPEYRDYWTEVKSYGICKLLDRGLHPRDFETLYRMIKPRWSVTEGDCK